ncbi:MAG TPA: AMP-binding protein [Candidatus Sulfotelmatobacter sp.]|nr:AMP-binding protein [Candidatus Sulfotelmatobacter sp.]
MSATPTLERWNPTAEQVASANLTAFAHTLGVEGYRGLLDAAQRDLPGFYERLVEKLRLRWDTTAERVLDLERGKPFARWFPGARLNAAANCLDRWVDRGLGSAEALVWEGEDGAERRYTFRELRDAVARLGTVLRDAGVRKGDRVGIFMPLIPETAIGLLAIAYIGAIAVPAFSGYGPDALATRLADAGAKVLMTVDGVTRRGKPVVSKVVADEALAQAPSVTTVLVYPRIGLDVPMTPGRDVRWDEAVARAQPLATYEHTGADDQIMLLYTSGSTGKPKGANHVHGGFPLKAMIDQYLLMDVKEGDRMLWFTDMGWMMGPWLVFGSLGLGASIMLYEGTPDYPHPDRLWSICARHAVTHLGIAPTAIRSLMAHGDEWPARHDLSGLRILASSGEPWNTEPWKWFATHVGRGVAPIINYSGGTEIGGGIVGCVPTLPLVPNSFHGPVPGMIADVYDAQGKPLRGAVGELVVTQPWPGMTQSFWGGDPHTADDARYLATYWERFPDTWVHGDWCEVDADGFWFIRGRSDDTINVAGKRVGPAEFESAVVSHPKIKEAAAIAVPDEIKGDVVVVLAVAKNAADEGDALRAELFAIVDRVMGKSLRPKAIQFVDDLPKTRNLKVMRRVARGRYLGATDLGDLSALDNPGALDAIDRRR